ncbi:MAG: glycosyltransferase involved in cell wall biosynthesis [Planctomycetota bacterium]|jgi:glycosyltransferase involved in cell wall biosynthesis
MRLLYVIHQFFPDCHSGTEQHCLAAAREAQRRGDEVTVLSLHWDHDRAKPPIKRFDAPYEGLRVIRLNHWRGLNPNDVLRDYENLHLEGWFQQVLDEVRPDVVHSFHLRQLGSNLLRVAKRYGARVIVSLTDFWFICPRFTLLRPDGQVCNGPPDGGLGCIPCHHPELASVTADPDAHPLTDDGPARAHALLTRQQRQLEDLHLADAIFAPSQFLADMFTANGLKHDGLKVVPYGLETGRIEATHVERPRQPLRLGFCGVLSPWKGLHLLIDAVRKTTQPVQLTVHGRTDEPMFQEYIDGLQVQASDTPHIRFAGPYAAADVARVFAEMDVLVVPSTWYENTPFVMLEAFAAGVPVIASDLGGLSEIIKDDQNGVRFRAGDADDLHRCIERIATTPEWFSGLDVQPLDPIEKCYDQFAIAYAGRPAN